MPTTLPSPCLYSTLVHTVKFSPTLQETHSFSHQVLCFKTFIERSSGHKKKRAREMETREGRGSSLTPRVSPSRAPVLSFAHYFQAPFTQAKTFIIFLHWQLIQSFSHAILGVTADMDVIRLLYFMLEKFPEYFKVNIAWQTITHLLLNS